MAIRKLYALFGTLIIATSNDAADIQAELDIAGDNELFQMIFKKMEMLGNRNNNGTAISKNYTELASALLQVAPVITIKGNITDPGRRYTISFTVQASQNLDLLDSEQSEDDDDDEEEDEEEMAGRGAVGLLQPLVSAVEPLVLGFAELLVSGVLSSLITSFLESTTLLGDGRLV